MRFLFVCFSGLDLGVGFFLGFGYLGFFGWLVGFGLGGFCLLAF